MPFILTKSNVSKNFKYLLWLFDNKNISKSKSSSISRSFIENNRSINIVFSCNIQKSKPLNTSGFDVMSHQFGKPHCALGRDFYLPVLDCIKVENSHHFFLQ